MDEQERAKREIIETAAKLQQGIDNQLTETEWDDQETLQNWNEAYGEQAEFAGKVQQAQYRQRLRNIKRDPQFMAALKKRGLTVEKFVELEQRNPAAYGQVYSEGQEKYLDLLQGKTPKAKDPFFESGMRRPHPKNVAKAREIAKKGKGDDDGMDAILGALMGIDD